MPRAFLVKSKPEVCDRMTSVHHNSSHEDGLRAKFLKDDINFHIHRNSVFDIVWKMMNAPGTLGHKPGSRDIAKSLKESERAPLVDNNYLTMERLQTVNDYHAMNFHQLTMSPLSPLVYYNEERRNEHRLLLHQLHGVPDHVKPENLTAVNHSNCKNYSLQPLDFERLLPTLRDAVACSQLPLSVSAPWSANERCMSLPVVPPDVAKNANPPMDLRSPLPRSTSTSPPETPKKTNEAASTPSKFNPFANSEPLTANVDTNRLYPRISQPKCDAGKSLPSSPVQGSQMSSGCGVSHPLFFPFDVLRPSSQAAGYLADLMSNGHQRMQFSRSKSHSITGRSTGVAASGSNVQQLARIISDRVDSSNRTAGTVKVDLRGRDAITGCANLVTISAPANQNVKNDTPAIGRYRCTECPKSYSTLAGLTKHQQFYCRRQSNPTATPTTTSRNPPNAAVTTVRDQRCPQCDKSYTSASALKMHIRTHTLPCRCRLCGKAFSRPWLLQGHLRTHTGEKPFECPHCSRAFADRSNLRAHLQTHYDVKQYNCNVCRRTFSRMSLLLKHRFGPCSNAAATTEKGGSAVISASSDSALGTNDFVRRLEG